MMNVWRTIALTGALMLGGCSAYHVITFKSSDDSFRRRGEKISMLVTGMPVSSIAGTDDPEPKIPGGEGERIRDACGLSKVVKTPTGSSAPAFAFAGLAVALVGVLVDAGITKLNEYTDKKIKEFKHSYSGRINVGDFALPKGNADNNIELRTRCIFFERKINLAAEKEDDNVQTALFMVLQFQPLGNRAYVLKPIYLDLTYSGARTSLEGKAVDLDIAVGIAVVRQNPTGNLVSDLVSTQNFSVRKIVVRGTDAAKSNYAGKFEPSTVIPALSDATAATVVVAVSETGDGSEEFGQFRKDTDAYGKVVKDFGLQQFKDALGVK